MSARRRRTSGLTLVEVTVSTGVLSVILAGLFASLATTRKVDVLTREHQAASEVAAQHLDLVLTDPTLPFETKITHFDVPFRTGGVALTHLPPQATLPAGWDQRRAGRVETLLDPAGRGDDLLQVTVSVAWTGADRMPRRLDLVSLRTR